MSTQGAAKSFKDNNYQELIDAARTGDMRIFEKINEFEELERPFHFFSWALDYAAFEGHFDFVEKWLKKLPHGGYDLVEPITYAAQKGKKEVLELLLNDFIALEKDLNSEKTPNLDSAFILAAKHGFSSVVETFLTNLGKYVSEEAKRRALDLANPDMTQLFSRLQIVKDELFNFVKDAAECFIKGSVPIYTSNPPLIGMHVVTLQHYPHADTPRQVVDDFRRDRTGEKLKEHYRNDCILIPRFSR